MRQITIFDVIPCEEPDFGQMTLKQIASYIGEKTGLNFIPDTRFHGDFNEYIAYYTRTMFFTIGLSRYATFDERNGRQFISAGYEDKKTSSGCGKPCDSLSEVTEFFCSRLLT